MRLHYTWRKPTIIEELVKDLDATVRHRLHATEELEYWGAQQQMHTDRETRLRAEIGIMLNAPPLPTLEPRDKLSWPVLVGAPLDKRAAVYASVVVGLGCVALVLAAYWSWL